MAELNTPKPGNGLDSGTYEIIKKRLQGQKDDLVDRLSKLNEARKEVFNAVDFSLIANQRITTENNCVARGIISIGNLCILGYNVHFGLKSDIQLSDVFSIYSLENDQFVPQPLDLINDVNFITDYKNLYQYYRDSIFARFRRTENYLYMIFQVSKNPNDLKAFKWLVKDRKLYYQDDRSIHEVQKTNQHEFKWQRTTLEDRRLGKYSHISILDKVFIEAIGGDITFKVEDNTQTGLGIYSEPVQNKDQQLDDAEYYYADLGNIILIRIKPYQEGFRSYIFNVRTKVVINIPMLNESGVLLPDNQGIIFSNGYYLQNGEYKLFDNHLEKLEFIRKLPFSNGEDVLYVFYQNTTNTYVLMFYNIIRQKVETPTICNGFTIFWDGRFIYFRSEADASKHHMVQIWQTPYALIPIEGKQNTDNELFKIGNKPIVNAMAECQELVTLLNKEDSYEGLYEDILKLSTNILDAYFWIDHKPTFELANPLTQIKSIANLAIDEFQKVLYQKKNTATALTETVKKVEKLLFEIKNSKFDSLEVPVKLLSENRSLQGEVIERSHLKYVDLKRIAELKELLDKSNTTLSERTIEFLLKDEALIPYEKKVEEQKTRVEKLEKVIETSEIEKSCKEISQELELLIDILNSLKIEDTTQVTAIVQKISLIFALLNEVIAKLKRKTDSLKSAESVAEFQAQLTLLNQSISNYLELADTPEKCDEYYTKISVQVEELESKFADFEEFTKKIEDKREEIIKFFNNKKNRLTEQINKRAISLEQIGLRILKNIENRVSSFKTNEEIQSFFSADLMIAKIRNLINELKELGDVSKAENLENSVKTSLEDSLRALRDKNELFVDGENIIGLGTYKFMVNKQPLDLTVVRKDNQLYFHLTGTNFYSLIRDKEIYKFKNIWEQDVVSENNLVYRAEYLAYQAFIEGTGRVDFNIKDYINRKVEQSYSESYLKGVSDFDAEQLYNALSDLYKKLATLTFKPHLRAVAQLFWSGLQDDEKEKLNKLISSAATVRKVFPDSKNYQYVIDKIVNLFNSWESEEVTTEVEPKELAEYLFKEFSQSLNFTKSAQANQLKADFIQYLKSEKSVSSFERDIKDAELNLIERFLLTRNWLSSFINLSEKCSLYGKYIDEACCLLLFEKEKEYTLLEVEDGVQINNLKGNHPVIENNVYSLDYHSYIEKLTRFQTLSVPEYEHFNQVKEGVLNSYKKSLKLNEIQPKVLSSFVRNKLINEVYLPLIGANLAKQIGVVGENKRTARMGMLLLVSPPGYGKTTLMEYIAKILGLNFVKINGPTIGSSITSIDPFEAKTSGAREELKKINLSFEMADNVMLYLDDIQHCSAEFLQKFISLSDGQRKMDGIFEEESKTYDLRGKRFCVIMAGNPYTESGEKFQIPDMLANRADVYNLGDIIGGTEHLFKLSLLENSVIENPYLQKLTSRGFNDFYRLINFLETGNEELLNMEGNYSNQEIEEFIAVLKKCIQIRELVLKVNKAYINSAGMDNAYRNEPAFKLQGSYRDMNKMVSKVIPLMNNEEVTQLMLTHYENESQTLTSDSEANMLKLKELAGVLNAEEKKRWESIKEVFLKNTKLGVIDQNNQVGQILGQLMSFNENLEGIVSALRK